MINYYFCKRISMFVLIISLILVWKLLSCFGEVEDTLVISELRNEKSPIPWWDDENLQQCSEFVKLVDQNVNSIDWYEGPFEPPIGGHCGARSHSRGPNQKVISYVLYGHNPGYWVGLPDILTDAAKLFPGYVVRLHTNPRGKPREICPLLLNNQSNFDVCDVFNLPKPLGNFSNIGDKMLLRMSLYGDPHVDRFLVRDTDTKLLQREVDAVDDWIKSGKWMHIMRDHPQHGTLILGGMYGIFQPNMAIRNFFSEGRKRIFNLSNNGNDQTKLMKYFSSKWVRENSVQHDSYHCKSYPGSIPFPTQRQGHYSIGGAYYRHIGIERKIGHCPVNCRPKNHLDWTRC